MYLLEVNKDLATQFKALGHPVRLRILEILLQRKYAICGDFVREFSYAQATISKHLQILLKAKFIRWEKIDHNVIYHLIAKNLEDFNDKTDLLLSSSGHSQKAMAKKEGTA